ncbi:MAG TPA: 3-mercaptopyruvate sulfurtransferase [Stellaceae bacterium]|nr:3-mercaptopyruvate sulfurtransferase [Stellaceae bacterium]HMD66404.1 3-mercaptopyruvate sulfurtransferase [Stellaceae bacterium]
MPYARPEALVGTDWLAAHLADPHVRVVDSSFKLPGITPTARQDFDQGHIPGAVFFDIDDIAEPGTSLPHMIPSADLFARKIAALGIGDGDRVVVYDSVGLSSAGRAWWMLCLYGHHEVAVLDGGLPKWKAEGRPLDTALPTPARGHFTARFDPSLVRDKRALIENMATRREQVVDARAAGRFDGTAPEARPGLRGGHIPGSRNLPHERVTDPLTRQLKNAEELSQLFRDAGVALDLPVVTSCGSGVTACALAFALHLIGHPGAAVYDGSWSEWGLPGDTPVETGPAIAKMR